MHIRVWRTRTVTVARQCFAPYVARIERDARHGHGVRCGPRCSCGPDDGARGAVADSCTRARVGMGDRATVFRPAPAPPAHAVPVTCRGGRSSHSPRDARVTALGPAPAPPVHAAGETCRGGRSSHSQKRRLSDGLSSCSGSSCSRGPGDMPGWKIFALAEGRPGDGPWSCSGSSCSCSWRDLPGWKIFALAEGTPEGRRPAPAPPAHAVPATCRGGRLAHSPGGCPSDALSSCRGSSCSGGPSDVPAWNMCALAGRSGRDGRTLPAAL